MQLCIHFQAAMIRVTSLQLGCHAAVHYLHAGADSSDQRAAGLPRGCAFFPSGR